MMLRCLIAAGVLFAGFQLNPQGIVAARHAGNDVQLVKGASQIFERRGLAGLRAWAHGRGAIQGVRRGADGRTITISFRDGTRASLLSGTISRVRLPFHVFRTQSRLRAPAQGRALVMEPFATELGLGAGAGDLEKNALQKAGYRLDELYDQQVTVASMANLHVYNVVYVETHSGVNTGGEGVVATGQLATANDAAMAPLLKSGAVILVHVSGSQQVYYGITSTFIRYYEDNFPGNSIVFLNGCETLTAPVFWQALQSRGVGVLVSWDKEATSMDNYLSGGAFFAEMAQGLSVKDALAAEKSAGYGTSKVGGTTANLGFVGNGSLSLQDAANPPAPTPTPIGTNRGTPGPSASPGVPVPGKTQTPAGPPLAVSLLTEVAAGANQTIRITSSPDTVIRVRIVFPTGDSRSTTTGTDAGGSARFVFRQHPGRVLYASRIAMVTVDAVRGAQVTSVVRRYTIGLSKFDLAVMPKVQAVGGVVTIQAHTRARALVIAVMHFPSGAKRRLQGKTGAQGWVRLLYRVDRYLKTPSNHVVVVAARVRIHGHGSKFYRARASYTIK